MVEGQRELLRSYSRLSQSWCEVQRPADVAKLAAMLIAARDRGRRVTFRAGGMSLHDQSLNDDLVISVERLDSIGAIDFDAETITVGAGAPWGKIVEATLRHGRVPYVVVTSKRCTAGGTLASDGISRYSPSYGSESGHVRRFDILMVGEQRVRTIEKPAPSDDDSPDAKLFRAVIGGFGYLGVLTSITYDLLNVESVNAPSEAPLTMKTTLEVCRTFEEFINVQRARLGDPFEHDLEEWEFPSHADADAYPSVYAVAFPHAGNGRGAVYTSTYARGVTGKPYVIFRPRWWFRRVIGWMLTKAWLKPFVNWTVWQSMQRDEGKTFVNSVPDYMFFMDGEVDFKERHERPPDELLRVVQQTFVVRHAVAAQFLDELPEILEAHRIEPTLFEFLFMPRDRILMSASYDMAGWAITLAFQDIDEDGRRDRAIGAMKHISRLCHERFGGRIHFTKNVYAEADVIRGMYAGRAEAFLALKREYDPAGVIKNGFFERIFP